MLRSLLLTVMAVSASFACVNQVDARGGFGGGAGRGGGAAGGFGGAGGMARPAARPSVPSLGGGGASFNRPNVSLPSASRPAVSRPATNMPSTNFPSAGLKPSTRPATQPALPSSRPTTFPGVGGSGATTRPGTTLPSTGSRPTTRPSVPNLGGGSSGDRPFVSPPSNIGSSRPGTVRPGTVGPGGSQPGQATRPSPGELGDFLHMDKPVRPETLPGNSRPNIERPVTGGNVERPGIGNLPGGTQRPGVTRPGNTRPGATTRPIDVGSVNLGLNNKISARPNWVSINSNRMISINNRWQTQIAGIQNWPTRYPARINYWHHWGDGVRYHWGHHYHNWFGRDWWYSHHHHWCGWHYGYWFNRYPWGYWWSTPSYAS
ncbi:MAG: hypothetical protein KDA99_22470, partial [Planctomycetales bacterium]|nr:hypothetical protein [Planctomycetales bacterium]